MRTPLAWLCPIDPSGAERNWDGHWLDRNARQDFLKEALPPVTALGSVGARDSMGEFDHRDHRNGDLVVAGFQRNGF
jgi:hypothetical protein